MNKLFGRYLKTLIFGFFIVSLLLIAGCSDDDPVGPTDNFEITAEYFPFEAGDVWYYSFGTTIDRIRRVWDDTTIAGLTCTKILDTIIYNGAFQAESTKEAWSIDDTSFKLHLVDGVIRPQPPLQIPFGLKTSKSYTFDVIVYITSGGSLYEDDLEGTLTNSGKVSHTVPAGNFTDVLKIHYNQTAPQADQYDEYYARDVGLIDNGDIVLDSAYVGGVWYRP